MVEATKVESAEIDTAEYIGQRVELKGKFGSIRYLGKLFNNPKAGDDLWLGIEWDEEGSGKHNGTVDGHKYFDCEFHVKSPAFQKGESKSCSFIRFGKIPIGGVSLSEAVLKKYKPESMMTDEELDEQRKNELAEMYLNTTSGGIQKIEVLGMDKAYKWRADVQNIRDIALEKQRISSVGMKDTIRESIPGAMILYLDKNLLYSWD